MPWQPIFRVRVATLTPQMGPNLSGTFRGAWSQGRVTLRE